MKNKIALIALILPTITMADSVYLCENGSKVYRSSSPDEVRLVDHHMILTEKEYDDSDPERVSRYIGKGYKEGSISYYREKDHTPYAAFILLNKYHKEDARLVLASIHKKEDKILSAANYSCKKL